MKIKKREWKERSPPDCRSKIGEKLLGDSEWSEKELWDEGG
jgi:hypothetical protein